MISTGAELTTFITGLNGGASIDATLLDVLVDNAKAILEEERPWMVLQKTDPSKTVATSNTWQTAISLATISDFSRLLVNQDGIALKLFDGSNRIDYYRLVPFDQRLEYKDVSGTCVYDENAKVLYLNGLVAFAGTLYISYLSTSTAIDLTSSSAVWSVFPSRFLPILGYYAIGIHKGAVDYDSINKLMLPSNQLVLEALKSAMTSWDNEKALATIQARDPSEYPGGFPRSGAVNTNDN